MSRRHTTTSVAGVRGVLTITWGLGISDSSLGGHCQFQLRRAMVVPASLCWSAWKRARRAYSSLRSSQFRCARVNQYVVPAPIKNHQNRDGPPRNRGRKWWCWWNAELWTVPLAAALAAASACGPHVLPDHPAPWPLQKKEPAVPKGPLGICGPLVFML